jgi:hypothetical protein
MLLAYSEETNDNVWCVVNNIVGTFNILLSGSELHENFKTFAISLFEKVAANLGWDPVPGESGWT